MKKIAVLGSTGSIGTQTLNVISRHPERFRVESLAAGSNVALLAEQVRAFRPRKVSVATKALAEELSLMVPSGTQICYGEEGLLETVAETDADVVVTALVGSRGLKPTLAAIESGKTVAIANKETLVTAGHIVTELANRKGVPLLPVDSEHSAIFQCLNGENAGAVKKITLTASGGAFRHRSRAELERVTVEEALRHPNWSMGAKVTIDSATMANKGLEVIEAHWLFGLPYDRIDVLLHPESIVHSMVEFIDHSVIAQLGTPDMRVPIQYALTYPERCPSATPALDLTSLSGLQFRAMDYERYPLLKLAFECGRAGGTAPAVFNAANEVAVECFLNRTITFLQIDEIVARVMDQHQVTASPDLAEIERADRWARQVARRIAAS